MDIDEAYALMLDALHAYLATPEHAHVRRLAAADELANALEDVDGWLKKGGFLPKAWRASG